MSTTKTENTARRSARHRQVLCILQVLAAAVILLPLPQTFASVQVPVKKHSLPRAHHAASRLTGRKRTNTGKHTSTHSQINRALMAQYAHWRGTRYRMGGTTRRGVDCSALMQKVFWGAFHRRLPRTAAAQRHLGKHITRKTLRPGDLVFFRPRPRGLHVGVWMGNGRFMHASGRKGVTVSRLNNVYWRRHYDTARRLALN